MLKLGSFDTISNYVKTVVELNTLQTGTNVLKNHFVVLDENKNIINVIDKVCDHAGGRLIHKGDYAICPMHGWQLNLKSLNYQDSHIQKSRVEYSIEDEKLIIPDKESFLNNPFKGNTENLEVEWRFLNHATIAFFFNGISLITDPWLFGPAFMTGWWLDQPSTEDSIEILKNADYIYVSHNHPDHLHAETLELVGRSTKIIVGDFKSKSTEKYLQSLGFSNVLPLEFNSIYQLEEDFQISILKSGDFRDDSGLYLNVGGVEILLAVDANFLNSLILPQKIDLLMTSFAGGASGFPLCFDNYEFNQKLNIIKRNNIAIKASVASYLKATFPRFYMPYAGMFKEKAERDSFIKMYNIKNSTEDYEEMVNRSGASYIKPQKDIQYKFINKTFTKTELNVALLPEDDVNFYIEDLKNNFKYDSAAIIEYMRNSDYQGKQVIYIIPTNDDFSEIVNEIVYCNFDSNEFKVVYESDINPEIPEFKVMKLFVRQEVIASIVANKLPWEDFSIGFQMRIERSPNTYESDFWFHFTNIYIDPIHYKYSPKCGSCTIINQNPLFL